MVCDAHRELVEQIAPVHSVYFDTVKAALLGVYGSLYELVDLALYFIFRVSAGLYAGIPERRDFGDRFKADSVSAVAHCDLGEHFAVIRVDAVGHGACRAYPCVWICIGTEVGDDVVRVDLGIAQHGAGAYKSESALCTLNIIIYCAVCKLTSCAGLVKIHCRNGESVFHGELTDVKRRKKMFKFF